MKLYQFPISHYCEKIRWALEYKNIAYQKINLLPGLHIKHTKKIAKYSSVPVLEDGNQVIQNSKDIIDYLEMKFEKKSLMPVDSDLKKQVIEWEYYFDTELGVHVRCVCYHILLEHPEVVIPFFTQNGPWYGKLFMKFAYNKLQHKMRHYMKINEETFHESHNKIKQVLTKIQNHLQEKPYLVGPNFTRADLTAAALLAPLCQPHGYGLNWPKTTPKRLNDIADEFKEQLNWVHNIYNQHRIN